MFYEINCIETYVLTTSSLELDNDVKMTSKRRSMNLIRLSYTSVIKCFKKTSLI